MNVSTRQQQYYNNNIVTGVTKKKESGAQVTRIEGLVLELEEGRVPIDTVRNFLLWF